MSAPAGTAPTATPAARPRVAGLTAGALIAGAEKLILPPAEAGLAAGGAGADFDGTSPAMIRPHQPWALATWPSRLRLWADLTSPGPARCPLAQWPRATLKVSPEAGLFYPPVRARGDAARQRARTGG